MEGLRQLNLSSSDVDATNAGGFTLLMTAALFGCKEAAVFLLQKGSDPWRQNKGGETVFDIARDWGHHGIVDALEDFIGVGESRAVEPLLTRLSHENANVPALVKAIIRSGGRSLLIRTLDALPKTTVDATITILAQDSRERDALYEALWENKGPSRFAALSSMETNKWKPKKPEDQVLYALLTGKGAELRSLGTGAEAFLAEILSGTDMQARELALAAMAQGHWTPARSELYVPLLKNDSVRSAAAEILRGLNWEPHAVQDKSVFFALTRQWDRLKQLGPTAGNLMFALLNSPQSDLRRAALDSFSVCKWLYPSLETGKVVALLKNEDFALREISAEIILRRGVLNEFGMLLRSNVTQAMRDEAFKRLKESTDNGRVDLLIALLRDPHFLSEPRHLMCEKVAELLGEIGDARAVNPLLDLLQARPSIVKVIEALGRIRDASALPLLTQIVQDRNSGQQVRESAAESIGLITGKRPSIKRGLFHWS